jgi:hypothetical protein
MNAGNRNKQIKSEVSDAHTVLTVIYLKTLKGEKNSVTQGVRK